MRHAIDKSKFLYLLFLGNILIAVGEPYDSATCISIGVILIYTVCIFYVCFNLLDWFFRTSKIDYSLFLLIFSSIFSFLFAREYTYEKFVPIVCFLELPILLSSFHLSKRNIRNLIYFLYFLFVLFAFYLSFTPLAYRYEAAYGIVEIESLTLGYSNPNQTAIYLTFAVMVLSVAHCDVTKRIYRTLILIIIVFAAIMIFRTRSRSSIIVLCIFLFMRLRRPKRDTGTVFAKIALCVPGLFAIFLLFGQSMYTGATFLGKDFDTGRQFIFSEALNSLNSFIKILFGNFKEYSQQNLHNSVVAIIVEFGIMSLFPYIAIIIRAQKKAHPNPMAGHRGVAFLSFCSLLLYSATEASFNILGSFYSASVFLIYYLCLPDENEVHVSA